MRRSARRCTYLRRTVPGVALPRRFNGRRAARLQGRRARPLLQRVRRGCSACHRRCAARGAASAGLGDWCGQRRHHGKRTAGAA
eukprot:scaffold38754_cov66-Phaeocystis_antarctica.AAC.1